MAEEQQKRQIAQKVRIKDIIGGRFVQEEGWQPNYVETDDGKKISRVNIIGVVLEKEDEDNHNSILIDDGTGKISARVFADDIGKLKNVKIGDVVLIIGRPREYGRERYVLLEIVKNIEDKKWIEVRRLELEKIEPEKKEEERVEEEKIEEDVRGVVSAADKIIEFVRNNDKGDGVDIEEVVKEFKEEEVKNLLNEGELFEIKPGRIKVLE